MTEPQVVIACAWYNRSEYLHDTVNSLLRQDHKSFHVVIVNDGSTDPKVREILDSFHDTRLTVIHQENKGFVSAIIRAIEQSDAPFIAIQGAGDVSYPTRISIQSEKLESDSSFVGTFCGTDQVAVSAGVRSPLGSRIYKWPRVRYRDFLSGNPISHGEVMFRRSIYDKVGGYRRYFTYGQDYDLWLRMSLHGDFATIQHSLYERRQFDGDGVSTDDIKQIIRIRLSDLAIHCAAQRSRLGYDMLDKYGDKAMLFCAPRRGSKFRIAKKIMKLLISGRKNDAMFWVDALRGVPAATSAVNKILWGIVKIGSRRQ